MKLHSLKFAIAASLTTAIIWLICSTIVLLLPDMSMIMAGDMIHMNTRVMMWSLTFSGFISGLILWSASIGISAWFFAVIYNLMLGKSE